MQNVWTNFLYPLLSSKATTATVAIVTAAIAFMIYYLRRRDFKKDAANIILLELQNAERNLKEAKKSYEDARAKDPRAIAFPEKLRLMQTESWGKYKYLFVRDFAPDQWEEIGRFYENCRYFDEAVEQKDNTFNSDVEEIRRSIHDVVKEYALNIAENMQDNPNSDPTVEKKNNDLVTKNRRKKDIAVNAILDDLVETYSPDKQSRDAAYYFNLLPSNITNTTTGQRLKNLAKTRSRKAKI